MKFKFEETQYKLVIFVCTPLSHFCPDFQVKSLEQAQQNNLDTRVAQNFWALKTNRHC